MGSKKTYLALPVIFFLLFVFIPLFTSAQLGTVYISAGYNNIWYGKSKIQVEQGELGNSYNLLNVKGDSKTGAPFSPLSLNYRLGFYFGEFQNVGMELCYDPFQYAVKDNQAVDMKGTYNSRLNVNTKFMMSKAGGSYYQMTGLNLFSVNFVRRYELFCNNAKSLRVDALGKIGVGPAMPQFESSLPVHPVKGPQFDFAGWNIGAEAGVKATIYRHVYLEIAGKYSYASLNGLAIYNGTAEQNLKMYGVIVSAGFTFSTMKLNPLFHKERRITTILPFFQHRDEIGKKPRIKKIIMKSADSTDSLAVAGLDNIPEFDEILDRKYRKDHPFDKLPEDSITNNIFVTLDSAGNFVSGDSSLIVKDTVQHLSRKELKKKKKQEKRDAKKKKKEGITDPETPVIENKDTTGTPAEPGTVIPEEPKAPEVKEPEVKAPESPEAEKKEPEVAKEPEKAPEMSKKERKKKEKEERKAKKKKDKEDKENAEKTEKKPEEVKPESTENKEN